MALSSALISQEPRAFSIGPWKVELRSVSIADTDTSGTVTAENLSEVIMAIPAGLACTDVAVSGATATLTFADPGAGGADGFVLLIGK